MNLPQAVGMVLALRPKSVPQVLHCLFTEIPNSKRQLLSRGTRPQAHGPELIGLRVRAAGKEQAQWGTVDLGWCCRSRAWPSPKSLGLGELMPSGGPRRCPNSAEGETGVCPCPTLLHLTVGLLPCGHLPSDHPTLPSSLSGSGSLMSVSCPLKLYLRLFERYIVT